MRYLFVAPWRFAKKGHLESLSSDYLARICHSRTALLVQPPRQPATQAEADQFLITECKKLQPAATRFVCLDERGTLHPSRRFASWLNEHEVRGVRDIVFCVGGAYGIPERMALGSEVELISLSPLTFPHEIALMLLLEQVYRARTILEGHPYHHEGESGLVKALRKKGKNHSPSDT